ncbi:MAG: hypothetical protein H7Y11_14200, partial [Armatimonadetes bacterium]|nr:hypothetical protein [Anaerolineae bacterium]
MPSALETLVKILKLEREQGCKNNAVIGGMGAYTTHWEAQARSQARNPEQRALVEELRTLLNKYEGIEPKGDRLNTILYMLDRITGRVPMPADYAARLSEFEVKPAEPPKPTAEAAQPKPADSVPAPTREKREKPKKEKKGRERDAQAENTQAPPMSTPPPARPPKHKEQDKEREKERKSPRPPQQPSAKSSPPARSGYKSGAGADRSGDAAEALFDTTDSIEATYTGQLDIPAEVRLARAPRKPRKPLDHDEAADILRGLNAPASTVRGVGPRMGGALKRIGIETLGDMLFTLPRRYDDYTRMMRINRLLPNTVATVIGTVRKTEIHIGRGGRKDFYMEVD